MSFSQLSLRRLRLLAPDLRTVMLFERVPLRFRDGSLPEGVAVGRARASRSSGPTRATSLRAHRQGNPVHVWTVDTAEDVELCLRAGGRGDHHQPAAAGCCGRSAALPAAAARPPDRTLSSCFVPVRPGTGPGRSNRQATGEIRCRGTCRRHARRPRQELADAARGLAERPARAHRCAAGPARVRRPDGRRRRAPTRPATTRCWCSPSW